MATSGQVNTNTITTQSGVKWYIETNWSVSSWNGNVATIGWNSILRRSSGSKTQVQSYGVSGNVNGNSWSKANGTTMYKDTQYGSGTFTLNGGGSVTAQVSGNIYGSGSSHYVSANQTWTLDNNVVAPTLTCSIGTRTETSIASSLTITNNGNATIVSKGIELFTDSACTNKVGTITGDSGTFTGLTANTTYYARAKAYNGTYTGYSSVITTSTYQYPYISAVETAELTIGNSQKLTLYNPLGRSVTIQMYQNPTIYDDSISVFYSGTTSGTSITFTPNASKMYQTIPTETNSTCSYSCKYGSSTKVTTNTYKYKVKGNNQEAPNFSNFSFVDGDSSATALTGVTGTNPSIMVKGLSDANFTITTSNKATSSYYAELDYYRFTWTNSTNKNYEASANVTASVTNGSSTTLSVTAYDKRGQNKSVSKTITLISPSNAVASLTTKRRNGIEAVTYLNGTISYWSGDWANGSSRPNQLIKVEMSPNNGTNKYDITSSITSHSSSSTSNNITTLTLATDTIQIHANGSSGGFVVGTAYNLTFYITTGYSSSVLYENSALGGTALVTSGKIGLARFKDSSGNYHYAIGKIPTSNYAFDVLGDTYCEGTLTATGNITAPQFNGALSGTATNATNINIAQTNPTSGTNYYIPFSTGQSGNQRERANDGLKYYCANGTASAAGTGELCLGNGTSTGTAGNKRGHLRLMSEKSGSVYLRATAGSTAQRWVTFPDLGGTAVVKQSDAITTETNGWYKVNMGAFTLYFKNGDTASQSFAANTWSYINMNLPSGITYNDAKMVLFGNAKGRDNAIRVSFCVFSGGTQLQFSWHNAWSGAITTQIRYNIGLLVFP